MGLAIGTSLIPQSFLLYRQVFPPLVLYLGSHRDMGRDHPLLNFDPANSGAWGRPPGNLGLTSPT